MPAWLSFLVVLNTSGLEESGGRLLEVEENSRPAPRLLDADEEIFPVMPVAILSSAGAVALVGGVMGVLALVNQKEVERLASRGQLMMPRDEKLLIDGKAYAWSATGLFVGAAVVAAAGGMVWGLSPEFQNGEDE